MTTDRPHRVAALGAATVLVAVLACGGDPTAAPPDTTGNGPDTTTRPRVALASPTPPIAAMVGDAFSFDARRGDSVFRDPVGRGLTYSVVVPPACGLTISGTRISGTPTAPNVCVASITAADGAGNTLTHEFRIVVFSRDMPMPALPATLHAYSDGSAPLPAHFAAPGPGGSVLEQDNTPAGNPITDAGATLGRVLFHDRRVSRDDRFSCSSCHVQAFGFGDSAQFSLGVGNGRTIRHAPAIVNVRFYKRARMFWDERSPSLEDQVLQPIQSPVEMGMEIPNLEAKLSLVPYYRPLFQAAFGSDTITQERIARALAQFVRSIVSGRAKFDSAFAGGGPPDFARVFTAEELEGRDLFNGVGKCATCHVTHAHSGLDPANTGLDVALTDLGAGAGRFKPPSLRNVASRRRFMHDGRFTTLAQVVDFYVTGVQDSPNLDPRMRGADGLAQRFNFTAAQRAALVAYLHTLTDHTVLTAAKWSDPFPAQ
jgi:cytochrome c peroxidase